MSGDDEVPETLADRLGTWDSTTRFLQELLHAEGPGWADGARVTLDILSVLRDHGIDRRTWASMSHAHVSLMKQLPGRDSISYIEIHVESPPGRIVVLFKRGRHKTMAAAEQTGYAGFSVDEAVERILEFMPMLERYGDEHLPDPLRPPAGWYVDS